MAKGWLGMEMTVEELRNEVSTALASVERGEAVTITCRGKPAARLVAADQGEVAQGAAPMPRSACGGIGKTLPTWTPMCANCAEVAPALVESARTLRLPHGELLDDGLVCQVDRRPSALAGKGKVT